MDPHLTFAQAGISGRAFIPHRSKNFAYITPDGPAHAGLFRVIIVLVMSCLSSKTMVYHRMLLAQVHSPSRPLTRMHISQNQTRPNALYLENRGLPINALKFMALVALELILITRIIRSSSGSAKHNQQTQV